MAFKDEFVNLVLQAKNLLSGETDTAADSVENLADSAEGLKEKLRALEDNGRLAKQFEQSEKALARTNKAYDSAGLKVEKLKARIEASGEATDVQKKELELAEKALRQASQAYTKAEKDVADYGQAMEELGLDTEDAKKTQQQLSAEAVKTKRAMQDLAEGAKVADEKVEELADSTEKGTGRLSKFGKSLAQSAASLVKWAAAAAAAAAAGGLVVLTRLTAGQADLARQALTTSKALGISTDALQSWQYAAETVGIEGDKTADIFKDLSEKLGDALLTGGGEAKEVIEGLGLSLEELIKLSPDQQLLKISNELDKLGDQSNKVFVLETLASDASKLLPLLENNAAGLRRLQEQAKERGVLISEQDLERLKATDDAFQKISDRLTGIKIKLLAELAPAFTQISNDFDAFLAGNPKLIEKIKSGFVELLEKSKLWVNYLLNNQGKLKAGLTDVGGTVNGLRLTFIALFRAVQSFGAGAREVAERVSYSWNDAALAILKVRNFVGLASDEAVAAAKSSLDSVGENVLRLQKQSEDYQTLMIQAGREAGEAFDSAAGAAGALLKDLAKLTAETAGLTKETKGLGESAEDAAKGAEKLKATQQQLGEQIASTVKEIEAAQSAWQEDPTKENVQRLEDLRKKYAELQDALAQYAASTNVIKDSSLVDHFRETAGAVDGAAASAKKAKDETSNLADETEGLADGVAEVGDAATQSTSKTAAALGGIFDNWANRVNQLSSRAAAFFQRELGFKGAAAAAATLEDRLAGISDKISNIGRGIASGGIVRELNKMARAGLVTEQSFVQQTIAVRDLTERIREGGGSMRELQYTAEDLERQFNLLDGSQLAPLLGVIQSVRREAEALNESLEDSVASKEQELAALQGDTAKVEELRFQEKKLELEQQLQKAEQLGHADSIRNAKEALALSNEIHEIRQRQARESDEQERKRAAERAAERESERQEEEREERQDVSRTETRTQEQTTQISGGFSSRTLTLDITAGGTRLGSLSNVDASEAEALVTELENSTYLTAF
jgi:hypothetical protein